MSHPTQLDAEALRAAAVPMGDALTGARVLVTGSSRGIGLAVAAGFADHERRAYGTGIVATPGVSHCSDMIDIYAQSELAQGALSFKWPAES